MKKYFLVIFPLLFNSFFGYQNAQAATKSRYEYEKTGQVIWEAKTTEKIVAITFDDGPHPVYTPDILDTLSKYNAKATFFVMGAHAQKYPHLVHREFLEGHEIANHTFNHFYGGEKNLKEELDQTANTIFQITGQKPTLFRPVGGNYNDFVIETARDKEYLVVLWSWHQDTYDWKRPGVNRIVNKVISNVKPGDIILLHDAGGDRSQTVEALDKILDYLQKNGYETVTVSELLYRSISILPKDILSIP
ncbi:polysaccharide deacetylase family protein [Bacillus norwichensis]|uniref:Polysaccharide deacetylase family protein n=1 Tax=Bacillus norwichensis TaxID=2762217 RepID=A0ABR8VRR5_9BACI|nr:polysaccharide deacetylase family protein [Bacillus norwichensis]MBD8007434.1 polysaccharide deacetylase family protein [Bacillus norwichensis]